MRIIFFIVRMRNSTNKVPHKVHSLVVTIGLPLFYIFCGLYLKINVLGFMSKLKKKCNFLFLLLMLYLWFHLFAHNSRQNKISLWWVGGGLGNKEEDVYCVQFLFSWDIYYLPSTTNSIFPHFVRGNTHKLSSSW